MSAAMFKFSSLTSAQDSKDLDAQRLAAEIPETSAVHFSSQFLDGSSRNKISNCRNQPKSKQDEILAITAQWHYTL
uniref:Uncharacterized protein n=1 Tax=Moniliophthora roreri TaxID=221103 RepID=A0A0W0GFJ0_MONRR